MITQKEVTNYLQAKKPFQASNIFACLTEAGEYVVYSYQTKILVVGNDGNVKYFNEVYYSATTRRLQHKICKAFNL